MISKNQCCCASSCPSSFYRHRLGIVITLFLCSLRKRSKRTGLSFPWTGWRRWCGRSPCPRRTFRPPRLRKASQVYSQKVEEFWSALSISGLLVSMAIASPEVRADGERAAIPRLLSLSPSPSRTVQYSTVQNSNDLLPSVPCLSVVRIPAVVVFPQRNVQYCTADCRDQNLLQSMTVFSRTVRTVVPDTEERR